ncbi:aminoglycoside 6-adenylyltransferase [Acutalibacter muris]|jgi:aminoglycoside 6-adenylyltransferase|uniref:Aminoglycoside 6-adenylyltransferase n=1 Tax=Acutalibacter muris TaxID=1796620 RepID=A0A1Z2XV48_9FIRM|nr:aminoglycoside 6-adenylyltransferase [Acutalibacter muris]ANU54467.1 hypothetical protein A4V00_10830 [Hungateiclostridiaceae bacterium KB18]ASB42312.1 hypothetical protein ADH66_17615 [Acutalibacter muris]QQR31592.1 aminoglycoside 6-adenylyltransferase [Acutalibacter muris]
MRTPEEILKLILDTARGDDNIRSVLMVGSRADPDCPADIYQDFDICYFVRDVGPYWDNMDWIESRFGRPGIVQKPESMNLMPPEGDGSFVYLMIFPDGNRIDLQVTADPYVDDGEPAVLLLDKDGDFPEISVKKDFWYVKRPSQKLFSDCCNEFHWCLNNVAKAAAREELSLAMEQLNHYVRDMLILMLGWYIGAEHGFKASIGKNGKYFKKLLPGEMYESFARTYSDADYGHIWAAAFEMLELFGTAARSVAGELGFVYDEGEERGIRTYMEQVRSGGLERGKAEG